MEIVITEGQYNRVVLNEQSDWYFSDSNKKKLYSDSNIEINAYGMNLEKGAYVLPLTHGFIQVENLNPSSQIIFKIENSSPIFESFGFDKQKKYSKQIPKNTEEAIKMYFNQSIGEGKFTGNLTFVYVIPGKTPVLKSINIPFVREGTVKGDEIKKQNEIFYHCKSKYNSNLLKKATDWWRKWLNNPSTKDRFAKSFKYDKSTVEKHFLEYNNILSQIPMEYVISDKPNGGWVKIGPFKDGYNTPIVVNCRVAKGYDENEALTFMIHEVQHVLNDYHKFHPYEDNIFNFGDWVSDKFLGNDTSSTPKTNVQVLKKFLMTQGFNENASSEISKTYLWQIENDEIHLRHPNELMSTLSEVRRYLKLTPDQKITKEMLINVVNGQTYPTFEIKTFLSQWLYSKKRLSDFLSHNNSIAMGKTNTTDRNLA
jgi:hypothetical protein